MPAPVPAPAIGTARRGRNTSVFSWHGWRLELPARWNPLKLDGDHDKGSALFADMHRPRLGLRWQARAKRRSFNAAAVVASAMRAEVGESAAKEARAFALATAGGGSFASSLLLLDPEPPGRDVWVAFSEASGRLVEVVYHARHRERTLPDVILPTLADAESDRATLWSVFELSCIAPAGYRLSGQRLMAGDLSLTFESGREVLTVRQVALAKLALGRMGLDGWVANQQRGQLKHYKPAPLTIDVSLNLPDGRAVEGRSRRLLLKRRFAFMRWTAPQLTTWALHDEARDRLVILQSSNDAIAREVLTTVGGVEMPVAATIAKAS